MIVTGWYEDYEQLKEERDKYKRQALDLLKRLKEERKILCDDICNNCQLIETLEAENVKLKKLDENVKNKIEEYKKWITENKGKMIDFSWEVPDKLKLLESLYE